MMQSKGARGVPSCVTTLDNNELVRCKAVLVTHKISTCNLRPIEHPAEYPDLSKYNEFP
jgi:hypothetical protein